MKRILFVQYADPAVYPPVERSSWLLADRGWEVRFLGVRAQGQSADLTTKPDPRISTRLLEHSGPGVRAAASYLRFYKSALAEIATLRPNVVYCSDLLSYPVGLAASAIRGVMSVLHEHDPPKISRRPATRVLGRIRRTFARRATICVIPQDQRASDFREETGASRVLVAYNCPSLAELMPTCRPLQEPEFLLWYHGSIGPGLLPAAVIRAISYLPEEVRFEFAGYETLSSKNYIAELMALAQELDVAHRVSYRGAIPRSELYATASRGHLGLCLFATVFCDPMVGASNKPFDYLACGLPLLTNSTPEWHNFYGAAGVAQACAPESPEDIARAILWFLDNPRARHAMAEQGQQLVRTVWNYEAQFAKVLEAIDAA